MDEQITFPDDWRSAYFVGEGVEFNPAEYLLVDDLEDAAILLHNEAQVRSLGGGWSLREENDQWYAYSRGDAAACKRCVGRKNDQLFLFKDFSVADITFDDDDMDDLSQFDPFSTGYLIENLGLTEVDREDNP